MNEIKGFIIYFCLIILSCIGGLFFIFKSKVTVTQLILVITGWFLLNPPFDLLYQVVKGIMAGIFTGR